VRLTAQPQGGRPQPAYRRRSCRTAKIWPAIVIVPVRSVSSRFLETVKGTELDPVPDPLTTASQSTFETAVHAHDGAEAVSVTLPAAASEVNDCDAGEIENVQGGGGGGAAACETVNVCPATVIVPPRGADVFAAAAKVTTPLPVPDAPAVMLNHGALEVAVQAHVPAEAVTAIEPDPPVSPTS
jgi:hypothetical protein